MEYVRSEKDWNTGDAQAMLTIGIVIEPNPLWRQPRKINSNRL